MPCLLPSFAPSDQVSGDIPQKAGWFAELALSVQRAPEGVNQVQPFLGPRDAHIAQPPLLFHLLRIIFALMLLFYIGSANLANTVGDAVGYRWGQSVLRRRWEAFVREREGG